MITIPFLTPNHLDTEINRLLTQLHEISPEDPKYAPIAEQAVKLYKLKEVDNNSKSRPSTDALINAAVSIFGILAVINYERIGNILTTKAVGWVLKPR